MRLSWSLCLLLACPATAIGSDHFASSAAEIAAAIERAEPGDTITLRDGEWTDLDLLFDATGTAEQPITLRAETPGKVVLRGKSRLRFAGSHLVAEGLWFQRAYHPEAVVSFRRDSKKLADHCRLTHCALVDCNDPRGGETRWISLYGQHNRVDHCWIEGKTTKGTTLVVWLAGSPAEHRIDHNYFGPREPLGKNGGETIRVGDSKTSLTVSRTVVEANCFERCDGEAEIISNKSCENIYRGNTFLRCSGALTLRHGNRCTVAGNFFLGDGAKGTGGVRIIGEGHRVYNNYFADLAGSQQRAALCFVNGLRNTPLHGYVAAKDTLVAFNTFLHCRQPFYIGQSDDDAGNDLPPNHCTIGNNLVLGRGPAVFVGTKPNGFTWQGNLLSRRENEQHSSPEFRTAELLFEQDSAGIWRPAARSAAIGAAEGDYPFVKEDIDGDARTAPFDVGCDQHSITAPTRRLLQPEDVGPSWQTHSRRSP